MSLKKAARTEQNIFDDDAQCLDDSSSFCIIEPPQNNLMLQNLFSLPIVNANGSYCEKFLDQPSSPFFQSEKYSIMFPADTPKKSRKKVTTSSDKTASNRISPIEKSPNSQRKMIKRIALIGDKKGSPPGSTLELYSLLYEEHERLGFGGFGHVFKTRSRTDGQFYAVKKFVGTPFSGDMLITSFDHQNVVRYYNCFLGPVFDFENSMMASSPACTFSPSSFGDTAADLEKSFSDDSHTTRRRRPPLSPMLNERPTHSVYVVMQYYPRGTLGDYLSQRQSVNVEENHEILLQVADGLAYLHGRGYIHRDLKPNNIFLTNDNIAKIGDFDLATADLSSSWHSCKVGTLSYASPEQWTGTKYTFSSDVWSLGMIMFEMFFSAATSMERDKMLQEFRACQVVPEEMMQNFPDEMLLLKKIMQKDPQKRLGLSIFRSELQTIKCSAQMK